MFIVILSNFGNTSRLFSAQNIVQYILDGTIQKAQTCVFYHMTYDSIVTWRENVSSISSGQRPNTR
jgi:hypothetical protein